MKWSPGNREARAQASQAKFALEAASLKLAIQRQRLLAALRKTQQTRASLYTRWVMAKNSVDLAQKNLDVERDRFRAGYATNDDLRLRINEVYQAQRRLGELRIAWTKSQVQYDAIAGNLAQAAKKSSSRGS